MNIRPTFLLILLILLSSVNATQYYVSTTGLDTNNGTQTYSAFLTIKKAIQTTAPGDIVNVTSGTYYEKTVALNALYINDANTTWQADPQGSVIVTVNDTTCSRIFDLDANNITIDGFIINASLTPAPQDFCEQGIYLREGRSNSTVIHNLITGTTTAGIQVVTSGASTHENARIYNNTLTNNTIPITLTNAISNNTNISYNQIGVKTNGYGIITTSNGNQKSYNTTIVGNQFNPEGNTNESILMAIYISGTSLGSGANNITIENNTFGNLTNGINGYAVRLRLIQNALVNNNTFWAFGTSNSPVFFESINDAVNITNNKFCDQATYCNNTGVALINLEATNNSLIFNNIAYTNSTEDGFFAQSLTNATANTTILNNQIYLSSAANTSHLIGVGAEGSITSYNAIMKNNRVIISTSTTNTAQIYFFGNVENGLIENNTATGGKYGVVVKLGRNVTVINNTFIDNDLTGMYDKGSNNSNFFNNTITNVRNGTYLVTAFGASASSRTHNASFFNNTFVLPVGSNTVAFSKDSNTANVTSDYNVYYLPFRSYNATFVNASTSYDYLAWQGTIGQDTHSSFFYTVDISTLQIANNSYYNGINWNSTPQIFGISIANATFYLNYSNGTNYLTLQNTSSITNATNYTFQAQLNTTDNFTWNVCYSDANGFVTCSTNWYVVKSDTISPTAQITSPQNASNYTSQTIIIIQTNLTDNTGLQTCYYNINNTVNNSYTCNTNLTLYGTNQTNGLHNLTIFALDNINNSAQATMYFFIDDTPPTITISSPTNNTTLTNTTIQLNTSITDTYPGLDTCWYNLNSTNNITFTCNTNITINTTNGAGQNITIYANDTVGNLNSTIISIIIDTTTPAPSSGSGGGSGGGGSSAASTSAPNTTSSQTQSNTNENKTITPQVQKPTNKQLEKELIAKGNSAQIEPTKSNPLPIIIILTALALTAIFIIMKKLENQKTQQTLQQIQPQVPKPENTPVNQNSSIENPNITSPNKVEK